MAIFTPAVQTAADLFRRISDTTPGERGRRASTGALVLRVIEEALEGAPALAFLAVRAGREIDALPRGSERATLRRLLLLAEEGVDDASGDTLAQLLVDYAFGLETTQRLPEADAALTLARVLAPGCAEVALHAGRVARRLRDPERALALYVEARELDGCEGRVARFASIGEAAVSADPDRALGRVIRQAVRSGDAEAAAVGLEERARVRRAAGRRHAAVRDLCVAGLRFTDAVDRARVAHELADIALAIGDRHTAREALLLAVVCGDAPQRDHARVRLHTLARGAGDEVGMRRWRTFGRPSLVSLSVSRADATPSPAARVLSKRRDWLEAQGTAAQA